jgi:hypothetical protein
MIRDFVKIANKLDNLGLTREADILDNWIVKMAAGFSEKRTKEITSFLTVSLPSLFQSAASSLDPKSKKILSYPLDNRNPLYMTIVGLINNPDSAGMSKDDVRASIIKGFNNTKFKDTALSRDSGFSYNTMTLADGTNPPGSGSSRVFDAIIVDSVFAQIQENKRSMANGASGSAQSLVSNTSSTYSKAPSGAGSAAATRKAPARAPQRDWAYYISKQDSDDTVGKNMQAIWTKLCGHIGMSSDYASFVRWYKSLGRNVDTYNAVLLMIESALNNTKDNLIKVIIKSGVSIEPDRAGENQTISKLRSDDLKRLCAYMGIDYVSFLPVDEGTSAEAKIYLDRVYNQAVDKLEGITDR